MKILYLADARSPIAVGWIGPLITRGHEAHLVTLYAAEPALQLASYHYLPAALSRATAAASARPQTGPSVSARLLRWLAPPRLRTALRHWLFPRSLPRLAGLLRDLVAEIQPDMVHALRIPYEGMLAATADPPVPLLVSVWGNDFTLHAASTAVMARYTRQTLRRADAVHTDCRRDLRLAVEWGFEHGQPSVVLPTGGGVPAELFHPPAAPAPGRAETVVNPRGLRAYVQTETFFRALPLVLGQRPDARFLCPAMVGEAGPEAWVKNLGLGGAVELLPGQTPESMADLYRQAAVAVSPTTHDGTPNTLLEAMACGCLPVAGDLESLREWITPGENGLLVDPTDPEALAQGMLLALEDLDLQERAAGLNAQLISQRAERGMVTEAAEAFYERIIAGGTGAISRV